MCERDILVYGSLPPKGCDAYVPRASECNYSRFPMLMTARAIA